MNYMLDDTLFDRSWARLGRIKTIEGWKCWAGAGKSFTTALDSETIVIEHIDSYSHNPILKRATRQFCEHHIQTNEDITAVETRAFDFLLDLINHWYSTGSSNQECTYFHNTIQLVHKCRINGVAERGIWLSRMSLWISLSNFLQWCLFGVVSAGFVLAAERASMISLFKWELACIPDG